MKEVYDPTTNTSYYRRLIDEEKEPVFYATPPVGAGFPVSEPRPLLDTVCTAPYVRTAGLDGLGSLDRKLRPIATGVVDYFPDALAEVALVSHTGNEQHHPGAPLHWDKTKSTDEADALMRHFTQRGSFDTDGMRHTAKVAWRALAMLQRELEG